jgi:hypothetical protein
MTLIGTPSNQAMMGMRFSLKGCRLNENSI